MSRALWTYELIERSRVPESPSLAVLAMAVDATRYAAGAGDECGIVIGGRGEEGHVYVLADRSLRGSPDAWARAAI